MVGSSIVVTQSTNGTSATTARPPPLRRLRVPPPLPQPACRQAAGDDPVGRGPALGRQHVRGGDEVGEGIALAVKPAVLPPAPAALAAAAHVRHRVDEAPVEQAGGRPAEAPRLAALVAAVAVDQSPLTAVAPHPGAMVDRPRDARASRCDRGVA